MAWLHPWMYEMKHALTGMAMICLFSVELRSALRYFHEFYARVVDDFCDNLPPPEAC